MILTKNDKKYSNLYDLKKTYKLEEGIEIVKKITFTKFDASFDVAVRLNIDPKKTDHMIRGTVVLPHGIGKNARILVICDSSSEKLAKDSGTDYVGSDEYLKKIEEGWCDFDLLITTPGMMVKVGRLGRFLGPKGLMPNPKSGTVTTDIEKTVKEFKLGRVEYRTDKYGIIHNSVGKVSFDSAKLIENIKTLIEVILKSKPSSVKGNFIESISLSSTMSKGVFVTM